jgi:hypothetical protein
MVHWGYSKFVDAMSYDPEDERISFDEALWSFKRIVASL